MGVSLGFARLERDSRIVLEPLGGSTCEGVVFGGADESGNYRQQRQSALSEVIELSRGRPLWPGAVNA